MCVCVCVCPVDFWATLWDIFTNFFLKRRRVQGGCRNIFILFDFCPKIFLGAENWLFLILVDEIIGSDFGTQKYFSRCGYQKTRLGKLITAKRIKTIFWPFFDRKWAKYSVKLVHPLVLIKQECLSVCLFVCDKISQRPFEISSWTFFKRRRVQGGCRNIFIFFDFCPKHFLGA